MDIHQQVFLCMVDMDMVPNDRHRYAQKSGVINRRISIEIIEYICLISVNVHSYLDNIEDFD